MDNDTATRLMEQKPVEELYRLLMANDPKACAELLSLGLYIEKVEQQLEAAVSELQAIRTQLADMKEPKDSPARKALQVLSQKMGDAVEQARQHLNTVKTAFAQGAKNAVSAFKAGGHAALHNIFQFFQLQDGLRQVSGSLHQGIRGSRQSIENIFNASAAYHEAGRQVKNIGRAITGKTALETANAPGKLARALQAPIRTKLALFSGIAAKMDELIDRLEQFEKNALACIEKPVETPQPPPATVEQAEPEIAAEPQPETPAPPAAKKQLKNRLQSAHGLSDTAPGKTQLVGKEDKVTDTSTKTKLGLLKQVSNQQTHSKTTDLSDKGR